MTVSISWTLLNNHRISYNIQPQPQYSNMIYEYNTM